MIFAFLLLAFEWFFSPLGECRVPEGMVYEYSATTNENEVAVKYLFTNEGETALNMADVRVFQPWNDNYPNAKTCLEGRVHAHVWANLVSGTYVEAVKMNGEGGKAFQVTKGLFGGYEITGRSRENGSSNNRGLISLIPEYKILYPGETYEVEGKYFDFKKRPLINKCVADKYVGVAGEKIKVNGLNYILRPGEQEFIGVELLGLPPVEELLKARARFLLDKQRVTDKRSPLYGAFLPYDNETKAIYYNENAAVKRPDLNEGRERVGSGIFLARYAKTLKGLGNWFEKREIVSALEDYAVFLRTKLQDEDYTTWSSVARREPHRVYNYPWIATFYLEMYELTADEKYLQDAYGTMRRAYSAAGGYDFYMIGVPVLRLPEMKEEFRKAADTFLKNGASVPEFEVNYEQSIVAPAVDFLLQFYLLTGEKRYLEGAEKMMPVLEAFNGHQPSWRLNDIAIRHWDGYWFGKREMWGDTFPHYWSDITAEAFMHYADATGKAEYRERAKAILLANLGNLNPDGSASCAYIYPDYVDGKKGKFADPLANDQDFAPAFYLAY